MLRVAVGINDRSDGFNILLPTYENKSYALHQIGSLKIQSAKDELKKLEQLSRKKTNRLSEQRTHTLEVLKRAIQSAEQGKKVFNKEHNHEINISDLGGKAKFKCNLIEFNPGYRVVTLGNIDTIEYVVMHLIKLVLEKEEFQMLENKIGEIRKMTGRFVTRRQVLLRLFDQSMKDCVETNILIKALTEIARQRGLTDAHYTEKEDDRYMFQEIYSDLKRAVVEEIIKSEFEVGEIVCILNNKAVIYDSKYSIVDCQKQEYISVAVMNRCFRIKYEIS